MKSKRVCFKLAVVLTFFSALGTSANADDDKVEKATGYKKLQAFGAGGEQSTHHYLGMREGKVGLPEDTNPNGENVFVLLVEKAENGVALRAYTVDKEGYLVGDANYVTAQGEDVVLTSQFEEGSLWLIRDPNQSGLNAEDRWVSLESAAQPGSFLRHFSHFANVHQQGRELDGFYLADSTWKFEHVPKIIKKLSGGGTAVLETPEK